ncbi:glycosyltransferase [Siculibacillus lacustris]|uniref:Glycosyltransferase n=1 Tax=Siculibacillus lacustris TaxID=1549641 RepID=A0A4Q9VM82_9HYPH|nr:glycosyltransferase [Siculibacillus lacustris]TBW36651.1 glycosyltransferase [Siculibacillus lacustris]
MILVDQTHLGRTMTGLERITLELFSAEALSPLKVRPITASGTLDLILTQQIGIPLRLATSPGAILLASGFPPSIPASWFGRRVVPYVHDCFLLTRPQDLNRRAALYMVPAFRRAVTTLPWFLVNSQTTAGELRAFARPDAEITLYRPTVRDVFAIGAEASARAATQRKVERGGKLDLIALGTVEPRKNLAAAADIVGVLRDAYGWDARLHVVGRFGWGGEADRLRERPGVVLHGYQEAEAVRALLASAHVFLSTSHDEGLGLPLLEAQYAGLPIVAPDKPVFREVLAGSGRFVDAHDPGAAAGLITQLVSRPDAFVSAAADAMGNIARWNRAAEGDHAALIERLAPWSE